MANPLTLKRLNLEIRDLPVEVNRILNTLAAIRDVKKSEIVRAALIEYAHRHNPHVKAGHRETED